MKKMSTIVSIMLLATFSLNGCAELAREAREPQPLNPNSPSLIQTFKAVQNVHTLAAKLAAEHKVTSIIEDCGTLGALNPYFNQTEQGLYLLIETYPRALCTPWGQVSLLGSHRAMTGGVFKFTAALFKRLSLEFVTIEGDAIGEMKLYLIKKDGSHREISKSNSEIYRGTAAQILVNPCGCYAVYKIKAIDDTPLPMTVDRYPFSHHMAAQESWNEMIARHQS